MKNFTKFMLSIGVLLTIFNESTSIDVKCKYEFDRYNISEIYTCDAENNLNITSPDNAIITSVTGTHEQGKSDNDVEGFRCWSCNAEYFPKGLEIIFPNLKTISFYESKIQEIHQSDLKPFPNLVYLNFRGNLIEVIEEDLFKFNPKLRYITFSANPINYIYPNVFDDLNELEFLWLKSVSCMDDTGSDVYETVIEVIQEVNSKCKDNNYLALGEKIKNLEIHHQSLNITDFNQQLVELEENLNTSKFSNSSIYQKRIKILSDIKEAAKAEYEAKKAKEAKEYEEKQAKEAKEAKEYEAKLPQIVKALEKASSEYQAQIADIQNKLNLVMEILSNIKEQLNAKEDKKSEHQ